MKQGRKRTLSGSSGFHNALQLQPLTQQPLTPRLSERLPSIDSFHSKPQHSKQLPPPSHQTPNQGQAPSHPNSATSEPPSSYRAHSSPNGFVFWKGLSDGNRRVSVSFPFDSTERPSSFTIKPRAEQGMLEWDEALVSEYVTPLNICTRPSVLARLLDIMI